MPSDLLERMRRNPAADWQIRDVEAVCRELVYCFAPEGERPIVMRSIHLLAKY
jgi:hypothetical protein